jgi:hypothetical protein
MEERSMAQSLARDAQDFARLMFQTIERLGQDGGWVRARAAFEQTAADHPDHAYVARIAARPAGRISLSAAAERVRAAEYPHIERRKVGTRRNAPVMYRIGGPDPGLDLRLPRDIPPSHPLLVRRRAQAATPGRAASARRAAMTEPPPKAPWRRRLRRRVTTAGAHLGPLAWSPRLWWERLRAAVSALAIGVTGR